MTDPQISLAVLGRAAREHRRFLVPLAIALMANVAAYAFIIAPLARRVATVEDRNRRAAQFMTSAQDAYERASGTMSGRDRALNELRTFYNEVLPTDLTGARRLTHLRVAQMAQRSRLSYDRASFAPVSERGNRLTQLKVEVDLSGRYEDVRRFIHQLETAAEFVVIDNVVLANDGQGTGLSVSMALSTYYLSPQP